MAINKGIMGQQIPKGEHFKCEILIRRWDITSILIAIPQPKHITPIIYLI